MSSAQIEMSGQLIRFGSFEVDMPSGDLRRKGMRVKLQDQPRNILILLLERPGDLISREDLRQRLWHPDTFVDFDHSLNTAMMRLREALGDSSDHPHYIETVPRKGYRFIAPVQVVAPEVAGPGREHEGTLAVPLAEPVASVGKAAADPTSHPERPLAIAPSGVPRRRMFGIGVPQLVLAGAAMFLLVALVAMLAHRSTSKALAAVQPSAYISSIMVMPMESDSGDQQQEAFADSMTDALTAKVAQIRAVRVVSRNTANNYHGDGSPLDKISRDLGVDAVVESTVMRSGDHVRITAELIQVTTDRYLWADTYQSSASDILTLQDQVIAAIVDQVRIKVDAGQQAGSLGGSPRPAPRL